jgi:hypothetical protein
VVAAPIGAGLARHEHGVVAGQRVMRAVGGVVEPRGGGAVVEARHDVGLELDLALEALDDAHELSLGSPGRLAADGQEVEHAGPARRGPPGRAEHERALEVVALGLGAGVGRSQGEMAAAPVVEQAAEDAAGIQALQAAPVDRAVAVHERGGMPVGDQPVVVDTRGSLTATWHGALGRRCRRVRPRAPARGRTWRERGVAVPRDAGR